MAASATVHSVLDKISKDHLECAICTNRFIDPTMLDCLHSFCFTCLKQLHQQDPNNSILLCPLCRKKTTLEDNTVDSLPKDFKLNALVDEFSVQEQLMEGHGLQVKCQACERGHTAVSRCIECEHFICQECQQSHQYMAVLKSHNIYSLAKLQSGEMTYHSKIREYIPKCVKHSDQTLNIYCNTCQKLECTTCGILDHGNPKHDLIGIPEALDKCKQEIAELVAKAKECMADIQTATQQASEVHKKLESSYAETNMKISQKAAKEIAKITQEEKQLKQEAESIYKDRVLKFQTVEATNKKEVTWVENKLDEVNQFMKQASCHEILNFKLKLINNLDELTKTRGKIVSERLSFLEFEEGERSMGKLVLEDVQQGKVKTRTPAIAKELEKFQIEQKWKLEGNFDNFNLTKFEGARSVAAFSNNEIVVVDTIHNELIALLKPRLASNKFQSILSNLQPTKITIKGLTRPTAVTVNSEDQLIVLDKSDVKVFNRKYKLLHQFQVNDRDFSPSCLAVDENNVIVVGCSEKEVISFYSPDGSPIRSILTPVNVNYLTTYKGQVIYINCDKKHLHSVDYKGRKVFSGDTELQTPFGVCCDNDGSIFVALYSRKKEVPDRICRYSLDGSYIGCAIESCGNAYDITFTPSGHLVVAALTSVKIYHRVSKHQFDLTNK